MSCLARIEIRTDIRAGVGSSVHIDRYALTESQFAMMVIVTGWWPAQATQQQAKPLKYGVEFAIIAIGLTHIGKVTLVPGFAHFYDLLDSMLRLTLR